VPPKVFGCVCFVRDHRPSVEKLDPQAVKCIFVIYSSTKKDTLGSYWKNTICEYGCNILWRSAILQREG
jgi:hypothetical protein